MKNFFLLHLTEAYVFLVYAIVEKRKRSLLYVANALTLTFMCVCVFTNSKLQSRICAARSRDQMNATVGFLGAFENCSSTTLLLLQTLGLQSHESDLDSEQNQPSLTIPTYQWKMLLAVLSTCEMAKGPSISFLLF